MKKFFLLVGILVAMSSMGWAAACVDGTLATYDASGFSCTIDGLTFSNFGYSASGSGGAVAPDAGGVNVIACPGGGSLCSQIPSGEDGFVFNASWAATAGQSEDALITYTVTGSIVDALELTGVGGVDGNGSLFLDETSNPSLIDLHINGPAVGPVTQTFNPVSTLTVTKDLGVNGNSTGTARISDIANGWSTVPEPSTLGFLFVGSLGLLGFTRRRQKKQAE
jgi:hypothetical protein